MILDKGMSIPPTIKTPQSLKNPRVLGMQSALGIIKVSAQRKKTIDISIYGLNTVVKHVIRQLKQRSHIQKEIVPAPTGIQKTRLIGIIDMNTIEILSNCLMSRRC